MQALRSFPVAMVFAATAALSTGCGGKQSGGGGPWWSSAAELVPATATWAMVMTPDERAADEVLAAQAALRLGQTDPGLDAFFDRLGVDLRSPTFFEDTGLDPTGQAAIFSTALLPVLILELADEEAFLGAVERMLDANPDAIVSDVELSGVDFRRIEMAPMALEVGTIGGWAVLRVLAGNEAADVDDSTFEAVLGGRSGSSLFDSPEVLALSAHSDPATTTTAIGLLRTAAISEAAEAFLLALDAQREDLSAMGLNGLATRYRSDDERQRCMAAAERLSTSVPWIGFVYGRDAVDPDRSHGATVIQLSMAAAERARAGVRALPEAIVAEGTDAAIFASGGLNLPALLAQNTADPSLVRCPNAAAITGALATFRDSLSAGDLDELNSMTDGRGAMALYDVRFAGFLPFVDAAIGIGSQNPLLLAEPLQQQIERNGGQGTVDATSPHTTVNYDLMHLDITLTFNDSNLAVGVGTVPQRALNAMLETPNGDTLGPFFAYRLWGPRLATILEGAAQWAKTNGMLTPEMDNSVQQMVRSYRRMESMTMQGAVEGAQVVFRLESRVSPP